MTTPSARGPLCTNKALPQARPKCLEITSRPRSQYASRAVPARQTARCRLRLPRDRAADGYGPAALIANSPSIRSSGLRRQGDDRTLGHRARQNPPGRKRLMQLPAPNAPRCAPARVDHGPAQVACGMLVVPRIAKRADRPAALPGRAEQSTTAAPACPDRVARGPAGPRRMLAAPGIGREFAGPGATHPRLPIVPPDPACQIVENSRRSDERTGANGRPRHVCTPRDRLIERSIGARRAARSGNTPGRRGSALRPMTADTAGG